MKAEASIITFYQYYSNSCLFLPTEGEIKLILLSYATKYWKVYEQLIIPLKMLTLYGCKSQQMVQALKYTYYTIIFWGKCKKEVRNRNWKSSW